MSLQSLAEQARKPEADISQLIYTRWSPRAMTGEAMRQEELLPLFEAARWAPSSYNGQPWHFIVAVTPKDKATFMTFLVEFNQQWCKNASALVVIISRNNFAHNNNLNKHHSFDTGAAWCLLALEGARRGLVVHGMAGFDEEKVRQELKVSSEYTVEAMCAIGKLAEFNVLPDDIAKMETPSQRKKVGEFVNWEGKFTWK